VGNACLEREKERVVVKLTVSPRRAAVQHLAIFVPWETFLAETSGYVNYIWQKQKRTLSTRISSYADNIQLLQRSAEDVKRDARQWAAMSGDTDPAAGMAKSGLDERGEGEHSSFCSPSH